MAKPKPTKKSAVKAPAQSKPKSLVAAGIKIIAENRKAWHDYYIVDKYEAGMVLTGSEVKSLRAAQANLKDSYVAFSRGEAFLVKAHISPYQASSYMNHVPERKRKLLLHREELDKIERAVEEKGFSCVPLKIYFKGGRVKVEIATAKGKLAGDKRDDLKKKDVQRQLETAKRR